MRRFTSGTFVSFTRFFASFTSARNFGECAMAFASNSPSLPHRPGPRKKRPALLQGPQRPPSWDRHLGLFPLFLRKGSHVVPQVPARFFAPPVPLTPVHFPPAVGDNVKQPAVREFRQRIRVPPIF